MSLSMLATKKKKKTLEFLRRTKGPTHKDLHSLGHSDVQQTLKTRSDKGGAAFRP